MLEKIVKPAVILAPMAGYSDRPYREITRKLGSALSFTEFVAADAVNRNIEKTMKMVEFSGQERPVILQVFGSETGKLVKACEKLEQLQPDGIDINMGCSVKKVALKGAGAALMTNPPLVKELFSTIRKKIQTPVSAKIRLGWDHKNKNFLEIGKILEGEGAWGVFVHGRTRSMAYTGEASWDDIGELKNTLSIPVFGNGDIKSYDEAIKKIEQYKLDGVLIGRAAMGNPWIFSGKKLQELGYKERLPVILAHLERMVEFYGERFGVVLYRKHLVKYLKYLPGIAPLKAAIMETEDFELLRGILLNFNQ